ncbi:MAG: ATP-binding protein [Verrucomicrobia bacterium]|nr:ATP-binding protein [Verrucomicrobiota bacterium]
MNAAEFLLHSFEAHKAKGLAAYRGGERRAARHNLLKAAEYLFLLAAKSREPLRSTRKTHARTLLEMAKKLPLDPAKVLDGEPGGTSADAARWIVTEKPGVSFDGVAGLDDVKDEIRRLVIHPFQHPEATERFRKQAGGGVLLYGPPGTGKTMIAKAIAAEIDAVFLTVRCSDILSKWFGEAEQNLKALFAEARSHDRAVIFLDEVEAIVARRGQGSTVMDRVIPEFLSQLDGLGTESACLLVLGATNRPWDLDEAALRAGRFGRTIYVGLPNLAARRAILAQTLEDVPVADDVNLDALAEQLDGYSGADIAGPRGLIDTATDFPYERAIAGDENAVLIRNDLQRALGIVKPTVSKQMLARYSAFAHAG